jgi:hypothetical protein
MAHSSDKADRKLNDPRGKRGSLQNADHGIGSPSYGKATQPEMTQADIA